MIDAKQITIFGGTGFIGRYVVDRLCDLGFTVRVATRSPQSIYFLRTAGFVGQVVAEKCDIFNDSDLHNAIAGSHYVVNLIGALIEKGKQNFNNLHHLFPERLAKIAGECSIERFIHVSALGADERAASRYAQTKSAGEKAVLANFPNAVIMRPSIVFGPEDNFFNRFAQLNEIAPFMPLIGGGKTKFQPVYVADVAQAIVNALTTTEEIEGQIFELGGDDQFTFKELMQMIMQETRRYRPLITIPFPLAKIKGAFLQHLPGQILTVDQVTSLKADNILSGGKPGLRDLGVSPTPLEAILPTYLKRFRRGGRFANRHGRCAA